MTPNQDALIAELESKSHEHGIYAGTKFVLVEDIHSTIRKHFAQSASPEPSGDVVERVAKDIATAVERGSRWRDYLPHAKAALAAMDTARGETAKPKVMVSKKLSAQMKADIADKIVTESRSKTDVVQDVWDEIMEVLYVE